MSSRSASIRARIERYGLRVVCLACGAKGRHRPSIDGRLRRRPCPKCGGRLRSRAWVERYPAAAAAASQAERNLRSILTSWN